jgi:catechol 2,3-dioxygenase-like lactoylglutathione lyase family enzyme
MRFQLALNVKDIEAAKSFYAKIFGVPPSKEKPGYANFALTEPPLKLVLIENPDASERINHLGVEVFDEADVEKAKDRLEKAELTSLVEDDVDCCYSRQSKVWAHEPDGIDWEWYRVTDEAGKSAPCAC